MGGTSPHSPNSLKWLHWSLRITIRKIGRIRRSYLDSTDSSLAKLHAGLQCVFRLN